MPAKYHQDFRDRAVRLATEAEADHTSQWSAVQQISKRLVRALEPLGQEESGIDIDVSLSVDEIIEQFVSAVGAT